MRRGKTQSCRRCGADKETLVHILCECSALKKIRIQTFGFARMDPDQILEARLSSIIALIKRAGLWKAPHEFKWEITQWASMPESCGPNWNPSRKEVLVWKYLRGQTCSKSEHWRSLQQSVFHRVRITDQGLTYSFADFVLTSYLSKWDDECNRERRAIQHAAALQ